MKKSVNLFTEADVTPWKDERIEGKLIIIKSDYFKHEYKDAKYQLVLATGGFGCNPNAMGNAIFVQECHNDNPEHYRIDRCNNDILGIATEAAIVEWKEIYGKFNEEVQKYLNKETEMIEITSGSFLEGCGVMVYESKTNSCYHLIVHKEKETDRLFIEIGDRKYYREDIEPTF